MDYVQLREVKELYEKTEVNECQSGSNHINEMVSTVH